MRFKFRLEKILHLVKLEESSKKMRLASQRKLILGMYEERENLRGTILKLLKDQQSNDGLAEWSIYRSQKIELNTSEIRVVETQIGRELVVLREMRNELLAVIQKRRALEKLREKKEKEFSRAEDKKQQKRIEELYRFSKLSQS